MNLQPPDGIYHSDVDVFEQDEKNEQLQSQFWLRFVSLTLHVPTYGLPAFLRFLLSTQAHLPVVGLASSLI